MSTRRNFMQQVAYGSAAVTALSARSRLRAAGAAERLRTAIIGVGGQGFNLLNAFLELDGVEIAYVCDPDQSHLARAREKANNRPQAVTDLRKVLDDKSVDAVVIATPDHWHAPAAILACQAGKHVYVEKPCSHNLRESRLLLDAARRHNVVVQHGTNMRTNSHIAGAVQMLREGRIGDVLMAKAWNVQRRRNIGHHKPSSSPAGVDYDMWVGPAEMLPFQENRFHYDWHWWYNFGTGDIGNDGAHEIDYARWGLGVAGLPSKVVALGGKYFHDDDQQYPDTAMCLFEYPGDGGVGQRRQLIFEMRLWDTNYPFNCDAGAEFYGTHGQLMVSKRGKVVVFDEQNQRDTNPKPKETPQLTAPNHYLDFSDAIKTGRRPNADIAIGHDSVAPIHLANIAVRLGRSLQVDPHKEQIVGDTEANELLGRNYRAGGHWAVPKG